MLYGWENADFSGVCDEEKIQKQSEKIQKQSGINTKTE